MIVISLDLLSTETNIQGNPDHVLCSGYITEHSEVLSSFSAMSKQAQSIRYSLNPFVRYCFFRNHESDLLKKHLRK